jgi:segregation and condensation protein A
MEESREQMMNIASQDRTLAFERIFDRCENRVHAIFTFLSLLELIQQKFLRILIGEGRNNFIIEYIDPADRETESAPEESTGL